MNYPALIIYLANILRAPIVKCLWKNYRPGCFPSIHHMAPVPIAMVWALIWKLILNLLCRTKQSPSFKELLRRWVSSPVEIGTAVF